MTITREQIADRIQKCINTLEAIVTEQTTKGENPPDFRIERIAAVRKLIKEYDDILKEVKDTESELYNDPKSIYDNISRHLRILGDSTERAIDTELTKRNPNHTISKGQRKNQDLLDKARSIREQDETHSSYETYDNKEGPAGLAQEPKKEKGRGTGIVGTIFNSLHDSIRSLGGSTVWQLRKAHAEVLALANDVKEAHKEALKESKKSQMKI